MSNHVPIRTLPSGVPGLDEVLGGGFPEFSLNLFVGSSGTGKTTLGHQVMFANATPERTAIFFTVIGEPPLKMLRYMQQLSFYDPAKLESSIRYIHLGEEAQEGGLAKVLRRIVGEVEGSSPAIVVVDSFRAAVRRSLAAGGSGEMDVQDFMQRLAIHLTSCEATTFLLGEYAADESDSSVFTVADGVVWLSQDVQRNSVVRKMQVQKMRGQAQIPGLQTMRLTSDGLKVFPRLLKPEEPPGSVKPLEHRLTTGTPELDAMMDGGIPRGYSVLVAGPSGSGKTILSNEFILAGIRQGEPGVIAVFEKRPTDYLHTTPHADAFEDLVREKKLEVVYVRPLDLSIDETMTALRDAVVRTGAKRAVIDSLSGLELALAPTFRDDFRESLYRMVGALTGMGVTVLSTVELPDSFTTLQFSPHGIAFLSDAIIMQRYLEIGGQLKRAISVVKVRGSQHSKDLREYEITANGTLQVGQALSSYEGLLTGSPMLIGGHDAARS